MRGFLRDLTPSGATAATRLRSVFSYLSRIYTANGIDRNCIFLQVGKKGGNALPAALSQREVVALRVEMLGIQYTIPACYSKLLFNHEVEFCDWDMFTVTVSVYRLQINSFDPRSIF